MAGREVNVLHTPSSTCMSTRNSDWLYNNFECPNNVLLLWEGSVLLASGKTVERLDQLMGAEITKHHAI